MYGQNAYGTIGYSKDQATRGEAERYYVDLTKLVPEFIAEKKEMHDLYITQGYEMGYLQQALDDIINQCFISTATWGLVRWEKIFNVTTNLALTYEQRREILVAKICGQGTTTVQMIKDTAAAFSGGEVDVMEDNANSRFVVRFIGIKGIPRNMKDFIVMLEEIKPAHLAYDFEYRFTLWDEIKPYQWNNFAEMSWDELRVWEGGN